MRLLVMLDLSFAVTVCAECGPLDQICAGSAHNSSHINIYHFSEQRPVLVPHSRGTAKKSKNIESLLTGSGVRHGQRVTEHR
jgi:hypothetical protein